MCNSQSHCHLISTSGQAMELKKIVGGQGSSDYCVRQQPAAQNLCEDGNGAAGGRGLLAGRRRTRRVYGIQYGNSAKMNDPGPAPVPVPPAAR